jgi:L-lactate dehydrogenase complex protein LldE
MARHTAAALEGAEYVVVPSGSCAAMIGHHYQELPDASVSARVYEFSQFLTDVAKIENVGARFEGVVTYHDSCHALRELKIREGPRRLLANVRGLELREMDAAAECCGFGGTFSVKFPGVSGAMARTKIDSIRRTGASTVVSIDSSCLMQLQGAIDRAGLPIRTMHLAEVLASR